MIVHYSKRLFDILDNSVESRSKITLTNKVESIAVAGIINFKCLIIKRFGLNMI